MRDMLEADIEAKALRPQPPFQGLVEKRFFTPDTTRFGRRLCFEVKEGRIALDLVRLAREPCARR